MNLTFKEKAAYGLGAVGKDMVYMLSASYVLYYFQDILGVSAIAMGVILLVARIFDAFNDPIMGIIVAKTKTIWGKFRPWLLIGTITNAVILRQHDSRVIIPWLYCTHLSVLHLFPKILFHIFFLYSFLRT